MAIGHERRFTVARMAKVCKINGLHVPRTNVLFNDAVCY